MKSLKFDQHDSREIIDLLIEQFYYANLLRQVSLDNMQVKNNYDISNDDSANSKDDDISGDDDAGDKNDDVNGDDNANGVSDGSNE